MVGAVKREKTKGERGEDIVWVKVPLHPGVRPLLILERVPSVVSRGPSRPSLHPRAPSRQWGWPHDGGDAF